MPIWCATAAIFPAPSSIAQDTLTIPRQPGQTAPELKPPVESPQSEQRFAPEDNTRVIPVIPPTQEVLIIPQASTDFLGKWGGHLGLARRYGTVKPEPDTIMSLMFGQRDGQVVMATTIYGNPESQVLETKADSTSPREVGIVLKGLDLGHDPPVRHIEKLRLKLQRDDLMKCVKVVDLYLPGYTDPVMEAEYDGELHPLTAREDRMLTEEVLRKGAVPRGRIEEGAPPPN